MILTDYIHVHVSLFGARCKKFKCCRFARIEMSDSFPDKLAFLRCALVAAELGGAGPETLGDRGLRGFLNSSRAAQSGALLTAFEAGLLVLHCRGRGCIVTGVMGRGLGETGASCAVVTISVSGHWKLGSFILGSCVVVGVGIGGCDFGMQG